MGGLVALQAAGHDTAVALIEEIVADSMTAVLIVATMTICIVIPKHAYAVLRASDST